MEEFNDATLKQIVQIQWIEVRRLIEENHILGDLLLDAYLVGFNEAYRQKSENDFSARLTLSNLEELVTGANLDPKKVLRRLYCPQQIEENGECSCQE